MRTLVVAPMSREARALRPPALVCGTEPGAGARVLALLDARPADVVVIAGVCGGLDPSLAPGALILGRRVIAEGKPEIAPDAAIFDGVRRALRRSRLPFVSSVLLTTPSPLDIAAARTEAWNAYGAGGVDMETYGIAESLAARGVPWIALRAVLDPAGARLPRAVLRWTGEEDDHGIAMEALRTPRDWPAYIRLALQLRASLRTLRAAVPIAVAALDAAESIETAVPLVAH